MDEAELRARLSVLADRHSPGAQVGELRRLPGGVSSLTYAAGLLLPTALPEPIVVKMAPVGLEPVRNRDVLRQARIIRLLGARAGMRVPRVLFEDATPPPVFVMELVRGDSYEPRLDVMDDPPTPDVVAARARAAAQMLGRMQSANPAVLGVGDEPVTSVSDELGRWASLFNTVDDDICPGHRELHARLAARLPEPAEPTLVHGDYRLANMLFDGAELTAVIDWELWSVGDPRTDLAWLLMHTDPAHYFWRERTARDVEAGRGMPTASALLEDYLSARPIRVPDLDWFLAYCHYKTASTIAALVKRNSRLADPDPVMTVAGESLAAVVARGHEFMDAVETGRRRVVNISE
jgi:aminoglycoside phosphotransferase (APT) family kinase protein